MSKKQKSCNYEKKYIYQRYENLVYLREEIAEKTTLSEFADSIGILKGTISAIENGNRNPSIDHICTYREYFKKNHGITVSTDYLLGFTDIITNEAMNTADDIGLSGKAVSALRTMKKYNDSLTKESKTPPATSIDGLNLILERLYEVQEQNRKNGLSSCGMTPSILSDIYFYINSDRVKCPMQDAVPLEDGVTNYVVSIPDIIGTYAEYNLIKHLDRLRDWYRKKDS